MFEVLEKGIAAGEKAGADYVEMRAEDTTLTVIGYSDGRVDNCNVLIRAGVACRVLYEGTWGVACGKVENTEILAKKACSLARAAFPHRKEKIKLKEINVYEDECRKNFRIPPRDVSFEEKISRLDNLSTLIKNGDQRVKAVTLTYTDSQGFKYLLTNEGTRITQETGHVYNQCWVTGKENDMLTAARDRVGSTHDGYEYFEKESEELIAERIVRKIILQLEGNPPKKGTFPCVLGPRVVGTLAHETLGHLAEADLTANSSFRDKLGEQIAPDRVTVADAPLEGGFGTSLYDDEGVPMQRVDIIKKGVLSGLLTDREYALRTGMPTCGASRAESFLFAPLIRMRNTFFEEGDYAEDELFEGIDFGYYCEDFRGGQAQLNSNFHVGIQKAFEIRNGEICGPVKDLAISGIATEALFFIEGVGKTLEFGISYCGKGQTAPVSMGGPHVRIREGGILFGGRDV